MLTFAMQSQFCTKTLWILFLFSTFDLKPNSSPAEASFPGMRSQFPRQRLRNPVGKVYCVRNDFWYNSSRWWFQTFFIFTLTRGNDPIWLIFFKWVETTNYLCFMRNRCVFLLGGRAFSELWTCTWFWYDLRWLLGCSLLQNPPKASHQWHWSLVSGIRTHLARQFRPARKAKAAKAWRSAPVREDQGHLHKMTSNWKVKDASN